MKLNNEHVKPTGRTRKFVSGPVKDACKFFHYRYNHLIHKTDVLPVYVELVLSVSLKRV